MLIRGKGDLNIPNSSMNGIMLKVKLGYSASLTTTEETLNGFFTLFSAAVRARIALQGLT